MIVIIILSILFIVSLVWFIRAIIVERDYNWIVISSITGTTLVGATLAICVMVALSNNSASEIRSKRRELHTKYEILNEIKDKPYVYDEILDYNDEVESAQECLKSPWTNWLYCPAYKDAKIIDIKS